MTPVFDAYAAYYDLLYRDKDYAGEVAYLDGLIRQYAPGAKDVLELGCGTGAHAARLATLGHSVFGIDLSAEMLARAERQRGSLPTELAARLEFAHGDVRSWRNGRHYDVVLSLFHVFSYQSSNADVTAAFETAAMHLKPGGLLILDFWYGPAVLAQRPETRVRHLEDERIRLTRIAEPDVFVNDNLVDVNYRMLVENRESGQLERFRETHRMRYFFKPELELFLQQAGFEALRFEEWMSGKPLSEQSWGAMLVARRPG